MEVLIEQRKITLTYENVIILHKKGTHFIGWVDKKTPNLENPTDAAVGDGYIGCIVCGKLPNEIPVDTNRIIVSG